MIPGLFVLIPLDRMFDDRFKQLRAIAAEAPSDIAPCVECNRVFDVHNMIAHNGLYVCARCKPVFLQKLAEGALIAPAPNRDVPARHELRDL